MLTCIRGTFLGWIAPVAPAGGNVKRQSTFWCIAQIGHIYDRVCFETPTLRIIVLLSRQRRASGRRQEWWWTRSFWSSFEWRGHSFSNKRSPQSNLVYSLSDSVLATKRSRAAGGWFYSPEGFVHLIQNLLLLLLLWILVIELGVEMYAPSGL